ncbi:MAG: thiamine phosphate synthase [Duodenibacillus sp.]|nr:thiamine phosphate synthase [Duodenibacillus sp.]
MRPAIDLSVYLVLDPGLCGGARGMVETALAAARGGATCVQLRAPQWKKRELAECGRALLAALAPAGVPLIVNDHADVCAAIGAQGLHVGQDDLSPGDARAVIGPDRALGLSITHARQLAAVDASLVDHIGAGPVFTTATKPDADPATGWEGLAAICRGTALPAVAIGGIKPCHAAQALSCGARGLAVVSAICGRPDPEAAARAVAEAVAQARSAASH